MNLNITGNHLEVSTAMRDYATKKLERALKYYDKVIDATVTLSSEPHQQHRAQIAIRVPGKDLVCDCSDKDLYAAIDLLADKVDRMLQKHKEKQANTTV